MDEFQGRRVLLAYKVILRGGWGFFLSLERFLKPSEMNWAPAAEVDEMQLLG